MSFPSHCPGTCPSGTSCYVCHIFLLASPYRQTLLFAVAVSPGLSEPLFSVSQRRQTCFNPTNPANPAQEYFPPTPCHKYNQSLLLLEPASTCLFLFPPRAHQIVTESQSDPQLSLDRVCCRHSPAAVRLLFRASDCVSGSSCGTHHTPVSRKTIN